MKKMWNVRHPDEPITTTNSKNIWKEFKNYYSEMIGLLKSTQTYDYLKLRKKMKDCKEYHIKKNRVIVREIYEKIETDGERLMKGVMVWEEAATVALEKYKDKIEETTIEDVNVAIKRGMRYRRKMKIYKRMEDARLLEYKMKQARVGKNSEEILKLREKEDMRRIDRLRRRRNRILNIKNNNKRILEEERRKISQSPRKKVVRKLERNMDKISFRVDSSRNRV